MERFGITAEEMTGAGAGRELESGMQRQLRELESGIPYMAGVLGRRDQPVTPGGGYISPTAQLRGVRNRESRTMGMIGLQGQVSGMSEADIINQSAAARMRFAEEEYQAELRIANLKATEAEKEQSREDALDQLNQKIFDAQVEREKAILELTLRTKQEFESSVSGLISAAAGGHATSWLRSRALGLGDKIIGKAAGVVFDKLSTASKQKTVSIPDVLGSAAKDASVDQNSQITLDNSTATRDNTTALQDLTSVLRGTGGGFGIGGSGGGGGGLKIGGLGGLGPLYGMPSSGSGGGGSGTASSMSSGIGKLMNLAAGGFLGYEGVTTLTKGGIQNKLAGAGEVAAAAGMILPLISSTLAVAGPIGMAAGAALGFVSSLFGDPKQRREHQISQELKYNQFFAPEQINATMTTHGTYADFDRFGGTRGSSLSPFPNVQEPYADWKHNTMVPGRTLSQFGGPGGPPTPQVNVTVHAIDSKSFTDHSADIAGAVHHALSSGRAPDLQQTLRSL